MASVTGTDNGDGFGVKGVSATGTGVVGEGAAWAGVVGTSVSGSGVSAFSDSGAGVLSVSNTGVGVSAQSVRGTAVQAKSDYGAAVTADGPAWAGVAATSQSGTGVSAFSDSGNGVQSVSNSGAAVSAQSVRGNGVESKSDYGIAVTASSGSAIAVKAHSDGDDGINTVTTSGNHAALSASNVAKTAGTAVYALAQGENGIGVRAESAAGGSGIAVFGSSTVGRGLLGTSVDATGTEGNTVSGIGVLGRVVSSPRDDRPGDARHADARRSTGRGVVGIAISGTGVEGQSRSGTGVWGASQEGEGVHGETSSNFAAIAGIQLNEQSTGAAIYGEHRGGGTAGYFKGNVIVTGHLEFAGADCAEQFVVHPAALHELCEPGTVMVIADGDAVRPSTVAYDRRVAGVVAGAGTYRPGIVLGRDGGSMPAIPLALVGRVFCKVDAESGAIELGDILTTSAVPGHAMKATDSSRAFACVLGKALAPLPAGRGLIPILVALQ